MTMKPMRLVFGEALLDYCNEDERIVVLDADVSSSTQTVMFAEAFPERFYNFGIAELNMTAAAAGFAACGDIPIVSSFAFLLCMRAGDAIRSLIAMNRLNVKLAGGYAGLSDFADGASHQSVTDLAVMRSMPHMTVLSPSDIESTRGAVRMMLKLDGPVYLRLSRAEVGSLHGGDETFSMDARVMREGHDVLICATGPVLTAALDAADRAEGDGVSCGVLEYPVVKPFDGDTLIRMAQGTKRVITVEEGVINGGLGSAVAEVLAHAGLGVPLMRHGLNDCFGESGTYQQLLAKHGLDADSIYKAAVSKR